MSEGLSFDHDAGWVEIAEFLDEAEVEEVLAQSCSLLELPDDQQRPRDKESGTQRLDGLDERVALVDSILNRDPLHSVVTEILGSEFRRDQIGFRNPKPGFGGQFLHADAPPQTSPGSATVATAIVALTDFTLSNGSTRLIPGSHKRPDLQRSSGRLEYHRDQILLTGKAGTAFVFSGHVLHSGTKNESDQDRPALQLIWRRA